MTTTFSSRARWLTVPRMLSLFQTFIVLSLSGGTHQVPLVVTSDRWINGSGGGRYSPYRQTSRAADIETELTWQEVKFSAEDVRAVSEVTDTPKTAEGGRHAEYDFVLLHADSPFSQARNHVLMVFNERV